MITVSLVLEECYRKNGKTIILNSLRLPPMQFETCEDVTQIILDEFPYRTKIDQTWTRPEDAFEEGWPATVDEAFSRILRGEVRVENGWLEWNVDGVWIIAPDNLNYIYHALKEYE